ncbi:MAG: hypothetical protein QOH79_338 [Acidimicrobiaceae bacterium]
MCWGLTGLVHEAVDVDDDAGDLARGDQAALVVDGNGEREPTPFDVLERGLGAHLVADRGRGEVVELDAHADRRRSRTEAPIEGLHRRLLDQRDHAGRAENGDASGAERDGGVVIGDGQPHLCGQA